MNDVAMAGDMALVVYDPHPPSLQGKIVRVLSNPVMYEGWTMAGSKAGMAWKNQIDADPTQWGMPADVEVYIRTAWLLPLRGNPDALTWTTETGRSVKA